MPRKPKRTVEPLPLEIVVERKVPWREEGDIAVILAPRFGEGILDRILRRILGDRTVTIRLDELGTFVWKRLDGRTPLRDIVSALEESFGDEAEKGQERIELFLRTLYREGWIAYFMPGDQGAAGDQEALR